MKHLKNNHRIMNLVLNRLNTCYPSRPTLTWQVILSVSFLLLWGCGQRQDSSLEGSDGLNSFTSNITNETIEDSAIRDAVKREFKLQDGVHASEISVACREGVVTLMGRTNNLLEKERAIAISKMVKGVRGVVDEVEMVVEDTADDVVKANIEKVLQKDPATDSYEITVNVNDGIANLAGVVDSWQEKQLAGKVAKGVAGLTGVQNNIIFEFQADRSDAEIQSDIEEAMKWDIRLDDGLVDVQVKDRKVTLSGIVGSGAEHSQAIVDAWVAGVNDVDADGLKVERWARDSDLVKDKYSMKPDDEVENAIIDAMKYDSRIHSFDIDIEVDKGSVSLSGTVDNLIAKDAAGMVAKNVVGVWRVENNLRVNPSTHVADLIIKRNIQETFKSDPYMHNYDIAVEVTQGVVTLSGEVDNFFERYRAKNIATATNGVSEITDDIHVDPSAKPYAYDFDYLYYNPYSRENFAPEVSDRDDEIAASIKNEFAWSPFVSNDRIDVAVENGIVTISGEVSTWIERERAEQKAFDGGAIMVNNQIEISKRPGRLLIN